MRRPITPTLLLALLAAPTADAQLKPGRPPSPGFSAAEREALVTTGEQMARHLVRVRIELLPVVQRPDGLLVEPTNWVLEGTCGGLVVSPDPLVMISASAYRLDHAGLQTGLASRFRDPPKRRYTILFPDLTEVAADLWHHDRSANLFVLRPVRGATLPDEIPPPIVLEGMRRPKGREPLGLLAYLNPDGSRRTNVLVGAIRPGKERFRRPVLMHAGLHQLGMPVFFGDGTLAGLVNIPPPGSAPLPRPRVDPDAAASTEGDRDPLEWATGYRRPILMCVDDLLPFVESLYNDVEEPTTFASLGVSLHLDAGALRVDHIDADGPAEASGLTSGEVITRVGGVDVDDVDSFAAALKVAREASPTLKVVILRDDREVRLTLELVD